MTKTVLVVEDEVIVRFDVCDYLRDHGFDVLEAGTAEEAIGILDSGAPVSLIFTDVQMPGRLSGLDLARHAATHYPKAKVLITSGHMRSDELPTAYGRLIDKPYSPEYVVERIECALQEA